MIRLFLTLALSQNNQGAAIESVAGNWGGWIGSARGSDSLFLKELVERGTGITKGVKSDSGAD